MKEMIVNLYPIKKPLARQEGTVKEKLEQELFQVWDSVVFVENSEDDYANFIEQAFRLKDSIDLYGKDNVWVNVYHPDVNFMVNAGSKEQKPPEILKFLPEYGFKGTGRHVLSEDPGEKAASCYMMSETFKKYAGREVELAGFEYGLPDDVRDVILDLNSQGVNDFYVKGTFDKSGIFAFSLPDEAKLEDVEDKFLNDAYLSFAHQEGQDNVFLVQETVKMEHEYRFFVVDHRIVTGAGAIVEHTPLDNETVFDLKTRRIRGSSDPVESSPLIVNTLLEFAGEVVSAFEQETPVMSEYSLDIALGEEGPLVVEVNSLPNSGFYASDSKRILQALL